MSMYILAHSTIARPVVHGCLPSIVSLPDSGTGLREGGCTSMPAPSSRSGNV